MKIYFCLLISIFFTTFSFAQNNLDSLLIQLKKGKQDTAKVTTYYAVSKIYFEEDLEKADYYNTLGMRLAKKLQFKLGEVRTLHLKGTILNKLGEYDSAIFIFNTGLKLATTKDLMEFKHRIISGITISYWRKSDFIQAQKNQLIALRIQEKMKDEKSVAYSYNMLGILNSALLKYEQSISYYKKTIALREKLKLFPEAAVSYGNLGNVYTKIKKYDLALNCHLLALKSHRADKNLFSECMTLGNIGNLYYEINNYTEAKNYYLKGIDVANIVADSNTLASLYLQLGSSQIELKDFVEAEKNINFALKLLVKFGDVEGEKECYEMLGTLYQAKNNPAQSLIYFKKYWHLNDSLTGLAAQEQFDELSLVYETEKKDAQIKKKNAAILYEKQQAKQKIWIGVSLFVLLIIIFLLIYYRFKNRKKQEQLIYEKNASLQIIDAEQKERSRIARELHDGIGQKLTVLKMYASVQENNQQQIDLLDGTITEVRQLSHNLMPEILSLGIFIALKDICEKVNLNQQFQCVFSFNKAAENIRLAEDIEFSVYRIVQEVINNMLKHSKANKIELRLEKTENELQVLISDNGVGFDARTIHQSQGIGWGNILTRAKIINALVNVKSNEKGTQINLHITV